MVFISSILEMNMNISCWPNYPRLSQTKNTLDLIASSTFMCLWMLIAFVHIGNSIHARCILCTYAHQNPIDARKSPTWIAHTHIRWISHHVFFPTTFFSTSLRSAHFAQNWIQNVGQTFPYSSGDQISELWKRHSQ